MVGYWLVVLGEVEGLRWVLKKQKMAFTATRRALASKIEPGDRMVLYVGRGAYHNPTRDRSQIIGLATVRTAVRDLRAPIEIVGREFVCACGLEIEVALPERHGVPIYPFIRKLSFVKRPEVWGQYFRSSLCQMEERDFEILEGALVSTAEPRSVDPDPASLVIDVVVTTAVSMGVTYLTPRLARSPVRVREKALAEVAAVADDLGRLRSEVRVIRDVVAAANLDGERRFRLGSRAEMDASDFDRCEGSSDAVLTLAKRMRKRIHKVERLLGSVPDDDRMSATAAAGEGLGALNELLGNRSISVDQAIARTEEVLEQATELVTAMQSAFRGQPNQW
jgi:hypothetical protein